MLEPPALARSRALLLGAAGAVLLAVPLFAWQAATSPLFQTEGYTPHGYCFLWDPALTRLFVSSDTLIGLSYTGISGTLAYFVLRARRDLPFQWVFAAFAVFIVACGGTHYVDVLTLYTPNYWISASMKFVTAVASVVTAVALPPMVPRALRLIEVARASEERRVQLQAAHRDLAAANRELERLYQEKTGELAAIVESSQDAIIGRDLQGRVTSWNPAAERFYGYGAAEALGSAMPALLPADRAGEIDAILEQAKRGEQPAPFETVRVHRDGTPIHVSMSVSPIRGPDGELKGIATIARDVADRKRAEAERERLLAQERAARLEAEAAVRARDQFLTVAAHELKTPLTSLLGRAQVALRRLERDGRLEPNEARRALESINAQAVRSSRLVGQLFDVAALEAGQLELHLEPVDLGGLARRAVASTETLSPAHTVRVLERAKPAEPAEPAHHPGTHDMRGASAGSFLVAGDRDRLEQVLHNLLENAVKYSPEGGEVTVALEHVESGDVRLTVTDRGLGVPPEHRPHIFDRYYQAHGGEHRSGMGLGLYVSRQIVERHGGRIEAQFPPEGGTRIVITLPAARDTAAEGTPPLGAKEGPPA